MTKRKNEADRARKQYEALAEHYGDIGPADLLAAVMAMRNADKPREPSAKPKKAA